MHYKKNNPFWIYGKHCSIAALQNPNRIIKRLLVTKQNQDIVTNFGLKAEIVDNKYIYDTVNNDDAVIQGIAILTNPLKQPTLNEFLQTNSTKLKSRVVILDQLSDPQNVGAIFRSAVAFNADAIITTSDNSAGETPGLIKAAAGAFEVMPFIEVVNLAQAIKTLKDHGYWALGLDGSAQNSISTIRNDYDKAALILGSEEKGIRPLTLKNCDVTLSIPMNKKMESLNVATAAAIALYELYNKA